MQMAFDVYKHPTKGYWGVSTRPDVTVAEIKPDGSLKLSKIDPVRFAAELAKRVRLGYTRMSRAKYLHQQVGADGEVRARFTDTHPDLDGGEEALVLFTPRLAESDTSEQSLAVLGEQLNQVTALGPAADKWLQRLRTSQQYLAANSAHPAFVLVLAQWAMTQQRVVIATHGVLPQDAPALAPLQWEEFLKAWFQTEDIRVALNDLGWSLRDRLIAAPAASSQTNDNNQTTDDAQGLIAVAHQSAF